MRVARLDYTCSRPSVPGSLVGERYDQDKTSSKENTNLQDDEIYSRGRRHHNRNTNRKSKYKSTIYKNTTRSALPLSTLFILLLIAVFPDSPGTIAPKMPCYSWASRDLKEIASPVYV